ncbi:MAG: glycoside hydrolase family 31 protein, partial [Bacteroidota bacterium]|nr:glycoside hydrolase family 31 protein [Bacteroidota bacterium]
MKKIIFVILLVLPLWMLAAEPDKTFTKSDNTLKVLLKDGTLQLTLYSDRIIRVEFFVKGKDQKSTDLVIVKNPETIEWNANKSGEDYYFVTKSLFVRITKDGAVSFSDLKGGLLAEEIIKDRKLTPKSDFGNKTYVVQTAFKSQGEALYGMGQFQNGLMNWKNTPLRLKQYNQEIAVPFLVSTKGYGILWNNNSVTDLNVPEQELAFNECVDETKNTWKATFTPKESGSYNFAVESLNPKGNRFSGPILLTINGDTVIHYNTPWVPEFHTGRIFLEAGKTYDVVFTNTNAQEKGRVLYNTPGYDKTLFRSNIGSKVDYFFVYGGNPERVISTYRELTGKAPMFGKWVYGFWQCRERYHSQSELLENARAYRDQNIPVDNIVQDWNYWPDGTWGPEWNRKLYPDPADMCRQLKSMNYHLMVSVWPKVTNPALEKRYNLKKYKIDKNGNLDFFNPKLGENYFKMLEDSMYNKGVDAIWLDGSEPEAYPVGAKTEEGSFDKNALTYSLMLTRAVYAGHRKDFPNERVFNLTRSAFLGQQRYGAAVWSGDVLASWEQFREQIPAGLNYSMAGLPFWTTDIGGFFRDKNSLNPKFDNQYTNPEYKELLTRWFQFGTFCPIFRIHGYVSETEVWRYGKPFEDMAREFIDLRYRLMPYIYSLSWNVTYRGASMMKPLAHDFPNDLMTWNISDQFLFGSNLMICPVTKYQARSRKVYFPAGTWYNFWTGEKNLGQMEINTEAPLERVPIFIKGGSIIPIGPKVQYALQKSNEPIAILLYTGANGDFTLYEDDGETNNYERGDYSEIPITWNETKRELVFGDRRGFFRGMLRNRKFNIVIGNGKKGLAGINY